jgi:hypothetical protein
VALSQRRYATRSEEHSGDTDVLNHPCAQATLCSHGQRHVFTGKWPSPHFRQVFCNLGSTMLFLLIICIFVYGIQAQSIPTLHPNQCPSFCHHTRSLWNIVWSSLVTLFACIWVSVHPNIPAPTDGRVALVKQRATLLLAAVIAPELIIMFAMRQWVCARRVMRSAFGRGEGFASLALGGL